MEGREEQDLQVVVEQLTAEVERKETDLQSLTSELEEIKSSIHKLKQDRQECVEKLFQFQEVSPLLYENRHTQRELEEKRKKLKQLNLGEASEVTELAALKNQLEELQKGQLKRELDDIQTKNSQAITELNKEYEEKMQEFLSAQATLEKLRSEVAMVKASRSDREVSQDNNSKKININEKLDKLVLKTCQKAGLELNS